MHEKKRWGPTRNCADLVDSSPRSSAVFPPQSLASSQRLSCSRTNFRRVADQILRHPRRHPRHRRSLLNVDWSCDGHCSQWSASACRSWEAAAGMQPRAICVSVCRSAEHHWSQRTQLCRLVVQMPPFSRAPGELGRARKAH